ncbi:MAG: SRPBCC family protein [Candidatus Eremiobacteraeota bacterium]|nr:SRPBCC family protein [Candidatus Eremiobacteraeota bacterium]
MAASLSGEHSAGSLHQSADLAVPAPTAFELLCAVEKWPVWLSFLRSARRLEPAKPLGVGDEVAIRSSIPGEEEELYEVDRLVDGYIVSLVGAFSVRRRIDMRIEGKTARSKLVVRVDYPTYGGLFSALLDRMTARRRLEAQLADSLLHFKGLVEYEGDPSETAVLLPAG